LAQFETIEIEIEEAETFAILYLNHPIQLNALIHKLLKKISEKDFHY